MTQETGQPMPSGAPLVYALQDQALRLFTAVQIARKACYILPGKAAHEITVPAAAFAEVDAAAKAIEESQSSRVREDSMTEIKDRAAFVAELTRFCKKWVDYEPTRREAAALMIAWEKVAQRFARGN